MLEGLDLKTIAVCHVSMVGFVALVLLFCRVHLKTYAGFNYWLAGNVVAICGYIALLIRLSGHEAVSVLVGNALFVLTAVLRLEATSRFLRGVPAGRAYYLLIPIVTGILAWFYFIEPSISLRNLAMSLTVAGICLKMAWEFLRHAGARRLVLYRAISFMMAAFAAALLLRAVLWCRHPEAGLFEASSFHAPYVLGAILGEMGMGMAFLLANSQRLEEELADSEAELTARLAEIKVLRGMLPICASCKSIHDGHGHWEKIESYVQRHTEAEFSHSICPDCVRRLYPDYAHAMNQPDA